MGQRRASRELALQVLFQLEFVPNLDLQTSLANFKHSFEAPPETWEYALKLLDGVNTHRAEIDALIQTNSRNWNIKRMSLVDLNIMRIAAFEICYSLREIPLAVAVNEALEISKKYSTADAAAFINGVLDQLSKTK